MQSRDESNEIVQSLPIDLGDLADLQEKIKSAQSKGAVQHIVGELPKQGGVITVNGLQYKIEFADYVRGKYTIKMILK